MVLSNKSQAVLRLYAKDQLVSLMTFTILDITLEVWEAMVNGLMVDLTANVTRKRMQAVHDRYPDYEYHERG